ncbi:MAG: hypothetical protein AB1726_01480 [Planctomycetota bacterium]
MNRHLPKIATLLLLALSVLPASICAAPRAKSHAAAVQIEAQEAEALIAQGLAAMRKQDYAEAMRILLPAAQQGFAEAQCLVALMHQKGYGTPQNPKEAVRWYTLSSLQGWIDALFMLGQMYYQGEGEPKDLTKAADLFLLTAITGDADGLWAIGVCFAAGEGRKQDPVEGGAWLLLAANQNHPNAKEELEKLRPTMSEQEWRAAQEIAEHFGGLIVNDGFDPAKMPVVPVPPFMAEEAQPRTPPRLTRPQQGQQRESSPGQGVPGQQAFVAQVEVDGELMATGDLRGRMQIQFPSEVYEAFKQQISDPRTLLRDMVSSRCDREIAPDASARYDDASSSAIIDIHFFGFGRNLGGGLWEWVLEDQAFVGLAEGENGRPRARFEFKVADPDEPMVLQGPADYTLPAGASQVRWSAEDSRLSFHLPYAGPRGNGRLRTRFAARGRLMSCLYKVYGLETAFAAQWVGKAVFHNDGDGPITDLRVRFKLGNYSELDLWQKFPEVVPGQTVVAVYHPVLNKSIAELTSTTPANLLCEWQYTDSEGKEHEDSDGGRISILGRSQFVFSNLTEEESMGTFEDVNSNSELIAAWVSRDDPVVKQFAAAANKAAGGEGAPYSDEAAMKVLRAIYEIWQANNFTYQGPVGFADESMSFDNKIVQSMKFPRDVIRDRSATCIELACLYCAMAEAVGLESNLVLIPGHAYPLIELPSGNYCPVECTGVGGGQRYGTASFDQVVQIATENTKKAMESGAFLAVNIRAAWLKGVSNPELEQLPPDILQRWTVVLDSTPSGPSPSGPAQPGPTPPPAPASANSFLGSWSGQAEQRLPTGEMIRWPMTFSITPGTAGGVQGEFYGKATVRNQWGGTQVYEVWESFQGQVQGGQLAMRGTSKTNAVDGMRYSSPTDSMTLSIQSGTLVADVQLGEGGTLTFQAQRQR